MEREADRYLQAVRDSFSTIVKFGKNDVFVRYLLDQLEKNAAIFTEAASRDVLRVSEHEFSGAQLILDAFGTGNHVLRYTWKINPAQRLFEDLSWRRHFELTSSMVVAGALEISTIVMVESNQVCDATNVRKMLEFYACKEGMNAKNTSTTDWDTFMLDHGVPSTCINFGIYGEKLLFTAEAYSPIDVGRWSRSPADIKRLTRLFDAVWNASAIAASSSAVPTQKVSLSQLMKADSSFRKASKCGA